MNQKFWVGLMLSLSVGSFTACRNSDVAARSNPPPTSETVEKVNASSSRSHHWVQNDQLQVVMKKLGSTSATHWPNSLPDDPEVTVTTDDRNKEFKSGIELAAGLANEATRIPGTVGALNLSDADRSAFIGTANVLSDQAQRLDKTARRHNIEDMQKQLDAIRATCISCHTRFKDISGDLPPQA